MKPSLRLLPGAVLLLSIVHGSYAQTAQDPTESSPPPAPSAMDAELFYELLLGELSARGEEPAAGFQLVLDAARKTNDPALYQRAVEIAFQNRNGDAALQAALAWKQAQPDSREANRFVLQILLALNRTSDTVDTLRTEVALAPPQERNAVLGAIPRLYARVSDKKLASLVVEQGLADALAQPATAAAAWAAVGRARLAAGDTAGALEAGRRGQTADARSEYPAMLGLEMMDPKVPQAEPLVRKYMEGKPLPELRLGYARALIDAQRYTEARQQLQQATTDKPELAEAWLALGTLQLQENQLAPAEAAFKRYLQVAQAQRTGEERNRGLAQAYLGLSQVAEKRRDFAGATAWLDRVENPQDLLGAQLRRASILANQGKFDEARKLLRALPEHGPNDARLKLNAEAQLLREHKQYRAAYDLLGQAVAKTPEDVDLLYDQAMLAEKMNDLPAMERLLRQVIAVRPDYHHAYNALGYSLAERGQRLPEAKQLIQKAVELAPDDPFISDSLGWVEFRMGNKAEALRILEAAYKAKPDAEIAAHLGEVLWSMGQRDRAQSVLREGLQLAPDSDSLQDTLKRLRIKP